MKRRILLIGGGGHCRSVLDSLFELKCFEDIGIIDSKDLHYPDVSVVGTDDDLPELIEKGWKEAFITVGSIGNTCIRRRLYQYVKNQGFILPAIIDPSAIVARNVIVEEGVYIGKKATINTGTRICTGAIINTGAIIEHDCFVDEFSHISPGAILCGQVRIGHDSHIGAGTVVRQLINIGNNTLIGAGSVVVKDMPDSITAYGNPCRITE